MTGSRVRTSEGTLPLIDENTEPRHCYSLWPGVQATEGSRGLWVPGTALGTGVMAGCRSVWEDGRDPYFR